MITYPQYEAIVILLGIYNILLFNELLNLEEKIKLWL